MLNSDTRLRVYNRAIYDIGVSLLNGVSFNIKAGSFQVMTVNDIMYIESAFSRSAFFSKKLLEAVDDNGNVVDITELGFAESDKPHLNEDEIRKMLGKSAKAIEEWMESLDDDSEKHAVYCVAEKMDLPSSKLKVLSRYLPDKDWLGQLGE